MTARPRCGQCTRRTFAGLVAGGDDEYSGAMRTRCLWSVGAAVSLTFGCADLPEGDVNRCGNRVFEPELGEDCDGSAEMFGPDALCSDACRLVCDPEIACPMRFTCGQDGVCRTDSGAWAFVEALGDEGEARGAIELASIRSLDGPLDELFRVSRLSAASPSGQQAGSTVCVVESFSSAAALERTRLPCLDLRALWDLDHDGHDDIITSTTPPVAGTDTTARYEIHLAQTNWERSEPQPSSPLRGRLPVLYALGYEENPLMPIVLGRVGADVSLLDWHTLRVLEDYPDIIGPDLPVDSRIGVLSLRSQYATSGGGENDTLAVTIESAGRVELYDFAVIDGAPGIEQRRIIQMPDGTPIVGRALSLDINIADESIADTPDDGLPTDGVKDLLVTDGDSPHIAFGLVGGAFNSAPVGFPSPARTDQMFAPPPEGLDTTSGLSAFPAIPGFPIPPNGGLMAAAYINDQTHVSAVFESALVLARTDGGFSLASDLDFAQAEAADLDADGFPDFAMVARGEGFTFGAGLVVLRSRGEEFVTDTIIPDFDGPIVVADVDGNSINDILLVRPSAERAGWQELAMARGRPLQPPAAPVALATFPSITSPVFLNKPPDATVAEFAAVVETDDGSFAAVRFTADTTPAPLNRWAAAEEVDSGMPVAIAPAAMIVGEFDGDTSNSDLVLAVAPGRLVHIKRGEIPLIDAAHAHASAPLDVQQDAWGQSVTTRLGIGEDRDAALIAVPRDLSDAQAGSEIIVGWVSDDRAWTTAVVATTTQLIAKPPAPDSGGADPFGPDRAGATATSVDVDGDGIDEALVVSGLAGDPWFVVGADGAGEVRLLALVAPPAGRIEDVVADPATPGRVVWTGAEGTRAGTIVVLSEDETPPNAYEVDGAALLDISVVEGAGGLAVATGNFDQDGLSDVALGDATAVRIYRSVPTIE